MSDTVVIAVKDCPDSPQAVAQHWRRVAIVAAAFVFVVGMTMVTAHLVQRSSDPWRSTRLLKMKEELRAQPRNETLKTQIRELDLELRQRYFHLLWLKASGAYLLYGGVTVFLIAAGRQRRINRRPVLPKFNPAAAEQLARVRSDSRFAVGACGAAIVVTFAAVVLGAKPLNSAQFVATSTNASGPAEVAAIPEDCASEQELGANWPAFRGFDGSGVSVDSALTLNITNVIWKSPSLAPGFNSPVIFGDNVFFTGGDAKKREVFCVDAATGELRWRQAVENVPGSPPQLPEISETTGFCAPTVATDGRRVYAWFANGDMAAFSLTGQRVWVKHLGTPKNIYGHATSLRTWQGLVIVQFDQGEPEDRLSKLLALNGRTGATVWEKSRPVGASWATPIVVPAGRIASQSAAQIITLAMPWVISYAANNGVELWRAELLEGEVTPSPVFTGGLLYVVSPSQKVIALHSEGTGDVTKSHVSWTSQEGATDVTSPVSNGELVFTVSSGGTLNCLDGKDGKKLWEHDFAMVTQASPVIAGNELLVLSTKGDVVVVQAGREFRELVRLKLEDEFFASPALTGARVILRGNKNLWCLGKRGAP